MMVSTLKQPIVRKEQRRRHTVGDFLHSIVNSPQTGNMYLKSIYRTFPISGLAVIGWFALYCLSDEVDSITLRDMIGGTLLAGFVAVLAIWTMDAFGITGDFVAPVAAGLGASGKDGYLALTKKLFPLINRGQK